MDIGPAPAGTLPVEVKAPLPASIWYVEMVANWFATKAYLPVGSTGGFYMLHDFNSDESDGDVRRAVDTFLRGKPELLTEIPDRGGTALFRKL
jgi:hypothetical protein